MNEDTKNELLEEEMNLRNENLLGIKKSVIMIEQLSDEELIDFVKMRFMKLSMINLISIQELILEVMRNKICEKKKIVKKEKEDNMNLYECKKAVYVRLRKDAGFEETGNYGFCTINKNRMNAMQPCCENLCPLKLKV